MTHAEAMVRGFERDRNSDFVPLSARGNPAAIAWYRNAGEWMERAYRLEVWAEELETETLRLQAELHEARAHLDAAKQSIDRLGMRLHIKARQRVNGVSK